MHISNFILKPVSMITKETPARQRVDIFCRADVKGHVRLTIRRGDSLIAGNMDLGILAGNYHTVILLSPAERTEQAHAEVRSLTGELLAEQDFIWLAPRKWELYFIASSHTDIGLHNSQYIQRFNCSRFLEKAKELTDTAEGYRYTVEGTWFWNNYGADNGKDVAQEFADNYIRTGRTAIAGGTAGNTTHTFGMEEMCRSAYTRNRLKTDWQIETETLLMADINGMSWSLVTPYADAGFRNIIFAPNQWNPIPSAIFRNNMEKSRGFLWSSNAGGGGSMADVRYESEIPMLFYWQGADKKSRLLVWTSTAYEFGSEAFGFLPNDWASPALLIQTEDKMSRQLALMEEKMPYDIWLSGCYADDQEPDSRLLDRINEWNRKWAFPHIQLTGNLDTPFDMVRQKFGSQIPVLSGDITAGWSQLAVTTPELLAEKFEADRALPAAEKLAVFTGINVPGYRYPAEAFRRAWDALIANDEHSCGASGYQGRRVYETWMQHRDWIAKAKLTAETETDRAMTALADAVSVPEEGFLVFNPASVARKELLTHEGRHALAELPPLGYTFVPASQFEKAPETAGMPPVMENRFYKITFRPDGAMENVYDKELARFLFDPDAPFHANTFVYTNDNHQSFFTPENARFEVRKNKFGITVKACTSEPVSGAEIIQTVFLPEHEKRIDIDNRLFHVKDLINKNRYFRYGYYAFPFHVENAKRFVHLNGCPAEASSDRTGHGTETYLAGREWACAENGSFGIALLQKDSFVLEFDHIHPDKTDFGMMETGSSMYSLLFNDWLQMHTAGGSHVNPRFRYTVTSYEGSFQSANIPELAERNENEVILKHVTPHEGTLSLQNSFLPETGGLRLLAMKRAEDGRGIILRFHETKGKCMDFTPGENWIRNTVDERETENTNTCGPYGYLTYRLPDILLPEQEIRENTVPYAIGKVYTGLITDPCAASGEHPGHLYLLWGRNMEEDLSHYEVYRSEQSGFLPSPETFVKNAEAEDYRVSRCEDNGLKEHTKYYYRIRAVGRSGKKGPFSNEFCGITREELD